MKLACSWLAGASFQSLGTKPESSDIWNSRVSAGASSVAAVLRMKEGTASGPVALWGFRFFNSLWTPFQSTLMLLLGYHYFLCLGWMLCLLQ